MDNNNTNPVPTTPVGTIKKLEDTQVMYGPAPNSAGGKTDTNTSTNTAVTDSNGTAKTDTDTTTTNTTTPESNSSTISNVADTNGSTTNTATTDTNTSGTSSDTSNISNTATSPSSRTNTQPEMKVATDGTMSIDGQAATNEKLESYFDYTQYDDKEAARMVEGIFKSDTVTINGVTYKAELNENGEMVSVDGTKRLTQEELRSYFGDKGYEALVCKTTKDVTIDENGKVKIKDRKEKVKITIAEPVKDTGSNKTNNAATDDTSTNKPKDTQSKIKEPTQTPTGGSSGGGGYSGGSSGGGSYSGGSSSGGSYSGGSSTGGSSSGGNNSGKNSDGKTEEVEQAGTPVIMVDFGKLGSIRDEMQTLKGQLAGVCDDYGGTINGISGNSSAWSGSDKDTYVSQKKGYASNISDVSKTLGEFAGYLDTCYNNYEQLESKLAAKQIS